MALNNVPLSGQTLANTREPIRANFSTIDTAFSVNHVPYGSATQGKHNLVTFPAQAADPLTLPTEVAIYSKNVGGVPELFYRPQNQPIIGGISYNFTSAVKTATGETTLPSGVRLKWGIGTTTASGLLTVNFASAFTTIFIVQATVAYTANVPNPNSKDRLIQIYAYTNLLFSVVTYIPDAARNRRPAEFTWFAIGE